MARTYRSDEIYAETRQPREWSPDSSCYAELATSRHTIPWLTESRCGILDSYVRQTAADYITAGCGSLKTHERQLEAILRLRFKGAADEQLHCPRAWRQT